MIPSYPDLIDPLLSKAAGGAAVIDIADLRSDLALPGLEDDHILGQILTEATAAIRSMIGRPLTTESWVLKLSRFPAAIAFPFAPIVAITSVTYYDADGASQTLAGSEYRLQSADDVAWVEPVSSWPSTGSRADAVAIAFTAGYGGASAVPPEARAAIRITAAHWFNTRNSPELSREIPLAALDLAGHLRLGWVAA